SRDAEVSTGAALILLEPTGQNRIIVVSGANLRYTPQELEASRAVLQQADLLLLQLEMEPRVLQRAIDLAHELGVPVILNPGPAPRTPFDESTLGKLTCLTPNEGEPEALRGM